MRQACPFVIGMSGVLGVNPDMLAKRVRQQVSQFIEQAYLWNVLVANKCEARGGDYFKSFKRVK